MNIKKSIWAVATTCVAFSTISCDDESTTSETPKKEPFQVLTEVSCQDLISCKLNYNMGDTLLSAQIKKGMSEVDLTFGYDPLRVWEKVSIGLDDYLRNFLNIEAKKGKIISMVADKGANADSILYSYDVDLRVVSSRTVTWKDDATKQVCEKEYQWDSNKLSKLTITTQTFYGSDSVSAPKLDEYTFSYKMGGGPVVQWQFCFPIIMGMDFSWSGFADLLYSPKSNDVPYYCKAVHYPDANDKTSASAEKAAYSISTSHNKTNSYSIFVSCQEDSGAYWQKECKLTY